MSKARVIVLSVAQQGMSVAAAAARFGVSRQHVYVLLARYRQGGIDAVEPRSRRPKVDISHSDYSINATETAGPTKPKSPTKGRALCVLCRDSSVNDVATHHMAENGGFEPPRACTQHAFQACAIGH